MFGSWLTIVDRYIIKKYLGTLVFTLGVFTLIIVVFDISEKIDDFLKNNASFKDVLLGYCVGIIPFFLNLLSPLINFIAVIFFTAKMADQTEIVPILTGGSSFSRFLRPYFISASIIFAVSLGANVYLIPYTNTVFNNFQNTFIDHKDPNKNDIHLQLDKNTYVYMQSFNNEYKTGYQFTLEKFDGDVMKQKLVANRVEYDSLKRVWKIFDYTVRNINGLKEKMSSGTQKDTVLDMRPVDFVVYDNVYQAMSTRELNRNIEREKIRGTGVMVNLQLEKFRRFVYPLSSYVLTIIGVAISSRKVRGGVGLPLGIGIFLCFAYIVTVQFANVFALKAGLPAVIAVCIPNILFGALGLYLLGRAPK